MTKLQLSLTRILGKKELYFGCVLLNVSGIEIKYVIRIDETGGFLTDDGSRQNIETMEIIGHPATLSDFHRWMGELKIGFAQYNTEILCTSFETGKPGFDRFQYDSSKDLLDQDEPTIKAIINLIKSYERN